MVGSIYGGQHRQAVADARGKPTGWGTPGHANFQPQGRPGRMPNTFDEMYRRTQGIGVPGPDPMQGPPGSPGIDPMQPSLTTNSFAPPPPGSDPMQGNTFDQLFAAAQAANQGPPGIPGTDPIGGPTGPMVPDPPGSALPGMGPKFGTRPGPVRPGPKFGGAHLGGPGGMMDPYQKEFPQLSNALNASYRIGRR